MSREAGPITGYRVWRLLFNVRRELVALPLTGELQSANWDLSIDFTVEPVPTGWLRGIHGAVWQSPALRAECYRQHAAPRADCVCGIYAVRRPEFLPYTVFRQGFRFAVPDTVLYIPGAVRLEGRVIKHEDGWRAEYGTMEWLLVPDARPEVGWTEGMRDAVRAHLRRLYPEVPVLYEGCCA